MNDAPRIAGHFDNENTAPQCGAALYLLVRDLDRDLS